MASIIRITSFSHPVDQAYAIGFVGLKAQYSISSVYHNKSKQQAATLRVKELEMQQEAYRDHVRKVRSTPTISATRKRIDKDFGQ
jgi:hypothetical protein